MAVLRALNDDFGQSAWIDNLQRSWLEDGTLATLIDKGVRGLTSNPTIFANAISKGTEYRGDLEALRGSTPDEAYWKLVLDDVGNACDLFLPLNTTSGGSDGFVSVEVDPRLARDTAGTIESAKTIWSKLSRKNLLVKIPATKEGVPAVEEVIAAGISVNVTLIFSLQRYREVIDAYQRGIARLAKRDPSLLQSVNSVASFFVSRTDTKVDPLIAKHPELSSYAGKTAIAMAKAAYQIFLEAFSSDDWRDLEALGANSQRPLWASTSTKNPAYPELLYVENLIGPKTVNTMPYATMLAFIEKGVPRPSILEDVSDSLAVLDTLEAAGISLATATEELELEGVESFAASHESILELLATLLA